MSAALDESNYAEPDHTPPPPMPPGSRAPRRLAKLDYAARTITRADANGESTYQLDSLPAASKDWCLLQGANMFMRMADDPDAAFARLKAGDLPRPKSTGKSPPKPNAWRMAYAHALVEETKKSDNPLTLDTATDTARNLSRSALAAAKIHPLVVKHFHKLAGGTGAPSLTALA